MIKNLLNKRKAIIVGILILAAYSMLTYDITKNITWGVITDFISGLSVIGISVLMFSLFNSSENKMMNLLYLSCKGIEGILMIAGGGLLLFPELVKYRNYIYQNIHIYFFIFGALFFYILLFRTVVVPKFISVWGIIATVTLLIITLVKLFEIKIALLDILLLPMILNEIFLASWLIIKGFNKQIVK